MERHISFAEDTSLKRVTREIGGRTSDWRKRKHCTRLHEDGNVSSGCSKRKGCAACVRLPSPEVVPVSRWQCQRAALGFFGNKRRNQKTVSHHPYVVYPRQFGDLRP